MKTTMKIGRRGSGLAVRLPRELVRKYGLKEGDTLDSEVLENALIAALQATVPERDEARDC